jgi:hypothetical protein
LVDIFKTSSPDGGVALGLWAKTETFSKKKTAEKAAKEKYFIFRTPDVL